MSGITGILAFNPSAPVDGIDAMIDAAPWRGPDGVGVWRGDGAVLAHQALHVTPESRHEEQPLIDEEAGLVLVADARIDNRDELQRTLRRDLRRSVRRDVITDADLILAAYRRWGTDCAARLLGDFAFAVWDRRKRQLFAARDPMAMRPFYYRVEENRVLFGSEVKQILAAPGVPREIDKRTLAGFFGGDIGPCNRSFFAEIKQINPGSFLQVCSRKELNVSKYFHLNAQPPIRYKHEQEYINHFWEIFEDATRKRLRSVGSVGIFLSGGTDSVASAVAIKNSLGELEDVDNRKFYSYAWRFDRFKDSDETNVSDVVSDEMRFSKRYVSAEENYPFARYPSDGPDIESPFFGVYQSFQEEVLRLSRKDGVRVMFTGHRGDLVAGSEIYGLEYFIENNNFSGLIHYAEKACGHGVRQFLKILGLSLIDHIRFKIGLSIDEKNNLSFPSWVYESLKHEVIDADMRDPFGERGGARLSEAKRINMIMSEFQMWGTVWMEQLFSRYSCSFTDSWSDVRVCSFASRIPQIHLNRVGEPKRLPRLALRGKIPEKTRQSIRKVSPEMLYYWAICRPAADVVDQLSTNMLADTYDLVNEVRLRSSIRKLREERKRPDGFLWNALATEWWLRQFKGSFWSGAPKARNGKSKSA